MGWFGGWKYWLWWWTGTKCIYAKTFTPKSISIPTGSKLFWISVKALWKFQSPKWDPPKYLKIIFVLKYENLMKSVYFDLLKVDWHKIVKAEARNFYIWVIIFHGHYIRLIHSRIFLIGRLCRGWKIMNSIMMLRWTISSGPPWSANHNRNQPWKTVNT